MSAPSAPSARVLAQARFDAITILRNGEQLLVTIVLPALALIGLTLSPFPDLGPGPRVDEVVPGAFALAILSSAFTGQAISIAFDRRYGVLRLLGTTPLGRDGLLLGRIAAVFAVQLLQFVLLTGVGLALGWRPSPAALPAYLLMWVLGNVTFVSLAVLMGGTLRAEATLALANLLWVLMAGVGGVLFAASRLPAPWDGLVRLLPSAALGDGMRATFVDHTLAVVPALLLLAWGAAFAALTTRLFRWSD